MLATLRPWIEVYMRKRLSLLPALAVMAFAPPALSSEGTRIQVTGEIIGT
jgi:hypothetical protein